MVQAAESLRLQGVARLAGLLAAVVLLTLGSAMAQTAWPGATWETVSPAQAGLNNEQLIAAREYALSGGGSGFITRNGKLVLSWGDAAKLYDLKSTSKSIGFTAMGLAIIDGKLSLGDRAADCHPQFAVPPEQNRQTPWRDQIRLLHLATHTAGFEKPGGYTKLLFPPPARSGPTATGVRTGLPSASLSPTAETSRTSFSSVSSTTSTSPATTCAGERTNTVTPNLTVSRAANSAPGSTPTWTPWLASAISTFEAVSGMANSFFRATSLVKSPGHPISLPVCPVSTRNDIRGRRRTMACSGGTTRTVRCPTSLATLSGHGASTTALSWSSPAWTWLCHGRAEDGWMVGAEATPGSRPS